MKAIEIAKTLHEIYEESSKIAGLETQKECRVPFDDLPEKNKAVMIAMGHFVLGLREDFARQKCKEQDRNTRHNAAETILLKTAQADNNIMNNIGQELHNEIMNLKSKTPDFE